MSVGEWVYKKSAFDSSAERTIESSPAIYRWEASLKDLSPRSGRQDDQIVDALVSDSIVFCRPFHGLNFYFRYRTQH
jgi:hypothetical protein